MMSFDVSREESDLITKIATRAIEIQKANGIKDDRLSMEMDITAVHANGCPLRLQDLLEAKDGDFGHDVFGIMRYINRRTGTLINHFHPRYAR